MAVKAPFRLARIHRWVHKPAWAHLAGHDVPFSDGLSGEATLHIVAETPLLVGGARRAARTDDGIDRPREGEVRPLQLPDGTFAIPGSAMQGMARTILEIAAFGRLGPWIEDRKFGIRDLSNSPTALQHYRRRLSSSAGSSPRIRVTPNSQPGWLVKVAGEPRIVRCDYARIHVDEVRALRTMKLTAAGKAGVAPDPGNVLGSRNDATTRYKWFLGQLGSSANFEATFQIDLKRPHPHQGRTIDIEYSLCKPSTAAGGTVGTLVLTGKPQNGLGAGQKKLEFVFHTPSCSGVSASHASIPLDEKAWPAFLLLHEAQPGRKANPNWAFWADEYHAGRPVPVFYWEKAGKVETFGMAFAFKAAHELSTHDLLRNSAAEHVQPFAKDSLDMPHLIFGVAAEGDEGRGLKRRAWFGLGRCTSSHQPVEQRHPSILLSPKPSYPGIYVRQQAPRDTIPNGQCFATYSPVQGSPELHLAEPELAGVKLWPAAAPAASDSDFVPPPPHALQTNLAIQTRLHPLASGATFEAPLTFHNLRPVELGAVLWALSFGDPAAFDVDPAAVRLRHRLGMGKPYGLGQVAIRVDLRLDDDARTASDFIRVFTDHMNEVYPARGQWAASKQVKALLAAADPAAHTASDLAYMPLDRRANNGVPTGTYVGEKDRGGFLGDFVDGHELNRTAAPRAGNSPDQVVKIGLDVPPTVGARVRFKPRTRLDGKEGEIISVDRGSSINPTCSVRVGKRVERVKAGLFDIIVPPDP